MYTKKERFNPRNKGITSGLREQHHIQFEKVRDDLVLPMSDQGYPISQWRSSTAMLNISKMTCHLFMYTCHRLMLHIWCKRSPTCCVETWLENDGHPDAHEHIAQLSDSAGGERRRISLHAATGTAGCSGEQGDRCRPLTFNPL